LLALAAISVVIVVLVASVVYGEVAVIAGWDLRQLSLHLASVVRQNLPLEQGLRAFASGEAASPAIARRTSLEQIAQHVEQGMMLSDAMATVPGCFPPHYRALVRAGERGGNLARVFARLAETSCADRADMSSVQDSAYLASQLAVMAGMLTMISMVVVPQFQMMFAEMAIGNSRSEMLSVVSSLFLPVTLVLGTVAFVGLPIPGLGGRLRSKFPGLARLSARVRWKMPIFSRYERRRAASRYCLAAGELLDAGVPTAEALAIAAGSSGSTVFNRIAEGAAARVMEGAKLSAALAAADTKGELPRDLAWYVKLGEASGRLPRALARASESAEARSRTVLAKLVSLMLPASTIMLGSLVGMIAMVIMGALVDLMNALAG